MNRGDHEENPVNSPFSHDAVKTPFQHPLSAQWKTWVATDQIFVVQQDNGTAAIMQQFCVRGDEVSRPTDAPGLLGPQAGPMEVWYVPLSASRHACIVFAPRDFAIERFRHDLALLYMLGLLADAAEHRSFLEGWQEVAGILTGDVRFGQAQGWWHRGARVAVVGCQNPNQEILSDALIHVVGKTWNDAIVLKRDAALAERVFKKAARLLLREIKENPRTP